VFENTREGLSQLNPSTQSNKRIKVRLSIIKDVPYSQKFSQTQNENEKSKKRKEMKLKTRRTRREGNFNCGRWQPEEHERFIEAIMKYGNEWKAVQKHVGTRSSTQARSHGQKFFVKMKKANLLDFNIDFSKNSIKTLHEVANSMNADEYFNAIKALNCVAFERKTTKKKQRKEGDSVYTFGINDSSSMLFTEAPSVINFNTDDIFMLNTNDNTIFQNKSTETTYIFNKNSEPSQNESHPKTKKSSKKSGNTIIINNNFNTYNYNLNFNNFSNCQENVKNGEMKSDRNERNENYLLRKRNRLNSFEGFFNLFPDLNKDCTSLFNNFNNLKKGFDEKEYVDNFNCTFKDCVTHTDFDMEKELEEMIMLSHSEEVNHSMSEGNKDKNENIFGDIMLDFYIETEKKN